MNSSNRGGRKWRKEKKFQWKEGGEEGQEGMRTLSRATTTYFSPFQGLVSRKKKRKGKGSDDQGKKGRGEERRGEAPTMPSFFIVAELSFSLFYISLVARSEKSGKEREEEQSVWGEGGEGSETCTGLPINISPEGEEGEKKGKDSGKKKKRGEKTRS